MSITQISSITSLIPKNGQHDPKVKNELNGTDHGADRILRAKVTI